MKRFLVIMAAGLMLLSTACQAAPTPTPTETATVEPTSTPVPTAQPTWTPTPQPSPTPADTATPEATSTPAPADIWVNAANGLNLRAEAKADAKVVTTLKHQQHLVAVGASVGPDASGVTWENVRTDDGQTGWASSQFLTKTNPAATPTPAPTAAPTQAPAATTPSAASGEAWTTAPAGLNLRAQAVATSTVVAILPFGTHLALLSGPTGPDAGGITWQNVRTDDGKTGYVSTQFISATKPTTTTTPTPAATTPVAATTSATRTTSVGDVWVDATNGLNLRAQPNSTAAVVATLAYGQRLTALAPKSTPDAAGIAWQNVRTQANQTGWAAANYLSTTPPVTTTATPVSSTPVTDAVSVLLQRLNDLRHQNKMNGVTLNAQLATAAQQHSQDMAKTGNISHTGSDGSTAQQRITAAGYPGQHKDEVIYGGRATVDDAWYFWTNDRLHANILLNPIYREVGIAVVKSGDNTYYTIDFGGYNP